MINELIIHLGDTKTGSTSIQKALAGGFCKIPGKSIAYPTRTHHVGLAKTLTEKHLFGERETRFNRVYNVLKASDADYGIVTAEYFQFVEPQALEAAIKTYWPGLAGRTRLVAYVRPHAGKLMSAYAERVKLGIASGSVANFYRYSDKAGFLDYTPRFTKWREVFGDRFCLRPFICEHLFDGDVVADFIRYVSGGEGFSIGGKVQANSSLTLSQLAVMREVHRVLKQAPGFKKRQIYKEARNNLGRIVADYLKATGFGDEGEKLLMPAALAGDFKTRYAADARALDAAFFDGTPMTDDLMKPQKTTGARTQSLDIEDYFPPGAIEGIRAFSGVLAELLTFDPDLFRLTVGQVRASRAARPDT